MFSSVIALGFGYPSPNEISLGPQTNYTQRMSSKKILACFFFAHHCLAIQVRPLMRPYVLHSFSLHNRLRPTAQAWKPFSPREKVARLSSLLGYEQSVQCASIEEFECQSRVQRRRAKFSLWKDKFGASITAMKPLLTFGDDSCCFHTDRTYTSSCQSLVNTINKFLMVISGLEGSRRCEQDANQMHVHSQNCTDT